MPRPITEQIQGTYFRLRFTVAIIGLLFPVILYFGGKMNHFGLRGSMSAYYWATQNAQYPCGDDPDHSKTQSPPSLIVCSHGTDRGNHDRLSEIAA
jgi:hypothetical protein